MKGDGRLVLNTCSRRVWNNSRIGHSFEPAESTSWTSFGATSAAMFDPTLLVCSINGGASPVAVAMVSK